MNSAIGNPQGLMVGRLLILEEQRHAILRRSALKSEFRTLHIHLVTRFNFRPYYQLRILAIDDPKISQKLAFFWGIGINVFMGHLSTLSLSLVLVATIRSILKFESK